jgi:hypothetical protein
LGDSHDLLDLVGLSGVGVVDLLLDQDCGEPESVDEEAEHEAPDEAEEDGVENTGSLGNVPGESSLLLVFTHNVVLSGKRYHKFQSR